MLWSNTLIPTLKETPQEAETTGHKLLLRAGLIRMLMSGAYTYLPLGFRVLNNLANIIRQEMGSCGASELLLPALQPLELWQKTGRDKDIGDVMIRFTDRRGRKICLGPTHEEVITELVKNHIQSYKQLPLVLYQIQTKFRDEIRPRFGLIRSCEFIMKDAYSFDKDDSGLDKNYQALLKAYERIFKRCGLDVLITEAESGMMGGSVSHEFMAPASDGEDIVFTCPKCKQTSAFSRPEKRTMAGSRIAGREGKIDECSRCSVKLDKVNTIEIGHTFKLGTKYSAALGANFLDANGKLQPIIMGCYGIGVSRMISAVIEQNNDKEGIIWPKELAPYKVIILALDTTEKKITEVAQSLHKELTEKNIDVLLDDRDDRAGVKFKDADLLGIPLQVIIGKDTLKEENMELKLRRENKKIIKKREEILKEIEGFVNG